LPVVLVVDVAASGAIVLNPVDDALRLGKVRMIPQIIPTAPEVGTQPWDFYELPDRFERQHVVTDNWSILNLTVAGDEIHSIRWVSNYEIDAAGR
jgi:hypothetical protein